MANTPLESMGTTVEPMPDTQVEPMATAVVEPMEPAVDTSWVSPMGKRAKMLIDAYNSEDPDTKADAAEKIIMVCDTMKDMAKATGVELTEAQRALMNVYEEIKRQDQSAA